MSVPGPALLSVPAPEMLAASVSVSVKFAAIWPSLAIAGVTIAPARPPVPRLSVLPAPIDVAPGELTTPPSAMVSVPTTGGGTAAAGAADRQRIERIQDRARAGDHHLRAAVVRIADDRGRSGVDHAAVGNGERARPHRAVANEETEGAADVPGRAGPGHGHGRSAEERKEGGDVRAALAVEHAAVADHDGRWGEIADDRLPGDGHARARSGDYCASRNAEIGGGERPAVGDGKGSGLDDGRTADGERAAADRERRARAGAAEHEIAADAADIAAEAGAGQRQRIGVVELDRAGTGELAGERGAAGAYDAQQGKRTGRSDRDPAAARERPDLDKGPIADRQGRARVDGEGRFE